MEYTNTHTNQHESLNWQEPRALVELTLPQDANCFASKYPLDLPSKEELKARLEPITHDLDESQTP